MAGEPLAYAASAVPPSWTARCDDCGWQWPLSLASYDRPSKTTKANRRSAAARWHVRVTGHTVVCLKTQRFVGEKHHGR